MYWFCSSLFCIFILVCYLLSSILEKKLYKVSIICGLNSNTIHVKSEDETVKLYKLPSSCVLFLYAKNRYSNMMVGRNYSYEGLS